MSLNDGDFPRHFEEEQHSWIFSLLEKLLVVMIATFSLFPDLAQDAILTILTNGAISFIVLGLGVLSVAAHGLWVPVVLVVGLAIVLTIRERRRYAKHLVKVFVTAPKEDDIEDTDLETMAHNSYTLMRKLEFIKQTIHNTHREAGFDDLEAAVAVASTGCRTAEKCPRTSRSKQAWVEALEWAGGEQGPMQIMVFRSRLKSAIMWIKVQPTAIT